MQLIPSQIKKGIGKEAMKTFFPHFDYVSTEVFFLNICSHIGFPQPKIGAQS